jgi:hypothetical protein
VDLSTLGLADLAFLIYLVFGQFKVEKVPKVTAKAVILTLSEAEGEESQF